MKIEIDFDLYKELTSMRISEEDSYNNVIKRLLGKRANEVNNTKQVVKYSSDKSKPFICKGVEFPVGTKFRMHHQGSWHYAYSKNGYMYYNGQSCESVSNAASRAKGYSENGWRCWECMFPNSNEWVQIDILRNKKLLDKELLDKELDVMLAEMLEKKDN